MGPACKSRSIRLLLRACRQALSVWKLARCLAEWSARQSENLERIFKYSENARAIAPRGSGRIPPPTCRFSVPLISSEVATIVHEDDAFGFEQVSLEIRGIAKDPTRANAALGVDHAMPRYALDRCVERPSDKLGAIFTVEHARDLSVGGDTPLGNPFDDVADEIERGLRHIRDAARSTGWSAESAASYHTPGRP